MKSKSDLNKCVKLIKAVSLWAGIVLLGAVAGQAQVDTATLLGTVRDSANAVVPGAAVVITNLGTGVSRSFITDDNGDYRVPALAAPARYRVTVEKPGFKKALQDGVSLEATETLRLDFGLELGDVSQSVTVKETPPVVNSETVTMGESTSWEKLNNYVVPLPKMSATQMLTVLSLQSVYEVNTANVRASGSRTDMARFTYDGAVVDSNWSMPFASNTKEAKMVTVNANAEYATPATISATSNSGDNTFHANLNYSINNAALNALGPFPTARGPSVGGYDAAASGGGPVIIPKLYDGRNRTFFYASYNYSNPYKYFAEWPDNVPTLAMRNGDFSKYVDLNGNPVSIIDPSTGKPFPGNIIPANRINATSANIIGKFYPQPNMGDPNVPYSNYITPYRESGSNVYYFIRGDQNVTSKDTANFTFSRARQDGMFDVSGSGTTKIVGQFNAVNNFYSDNYAAGWTHVVSPRMVNEFRFHYNYINSLRGSNVNGQNTLKAFGITGIDPNLNYTGLPNINILDGIDGFGQVYNAATLEERRWNIIDNYSVQLSKHAIKMGFNYMWVHDDTNGTQGPVFGTYNFSGQWTGVGFADFMLGYPSDTSRFTPRVPTLARNRSLGLYVQDDYRITPRLTLNLGVRYDLDAIPTDAQGLYYSFDPKIGALVFPNQKAMNAVSPAFNKAIPLVLASAVGYPSKLLAPDYKNLYPRVGLAFRPFNNARTVIRAGYGIFNVGKMGGANRFVPSAFVQTTGPFALTEAFINTKGSNGLPVLSFPDPFPSAVGSGPSSYAITATNPHLRDGYQQQWNFTMEREWLGTAFSLGYIGSKGTNLNYTRNINLPPASTTLYSPSRYIYANFTSVGWVDQGANDTYHSMQFEFTRPLTKGLYLHGGWVWAKELTDAESSGSSSPIGSMSSDPYNRSYDKGRANAIPTHRFVVDYVLQLPVGRNREFLNHLPRVVDYVIGGWTNSTFYRIDSGTPFTPFIYGPDPSGTGTIMGRPDRIASGQVSNFTQTSLYDPGAFVVPQSDIGRYGNSGRNILTGPPGWYLTTAIHKDIPIHERLRLRISAFMDNPFNMHSWGTPNLNLMSPTAGYARSFFMDPRQIRFGAVLEF